ncbi:Endocytosis and vacuole integrity protein, partial [Rhizoclosmatium hyalinum]
MSSGHNLVHGWFLIFEVIRSVVVGGRKLGGASGGAVSSGALMNMVEASNSLDAAQSSKAAILVRSAFPSVQLVCGDFLGSLSPDVLFECIQTLGCFGSQPDDINISLTTIGLLWNISDNILTRRQKLEKEGKVESPANRSNPSLHVGSVEKLDASNGTSALSIPQNTRAMLTSRENITGPVTTKTMDVLWMHLLAHLSQLCSDLRPEVRNSANQTIFKTITINGRRLTLEAWDECIWNILFPLLERVKISSEQAELIQQAPQSNALAASGIPINPRDSPTKFWNETKTLTLTGITNLIIQFFP